jgi:DNA polymerase-1
MHGIDVETTALWPEEGNLRLLQISDGKRADVYDAFRQSEEMLRRAVERQDELVAHNAPFERTWLKAALSLDRPDLQDTMVMSQALYTGTNAARAKQFSHSLAAVVKRELKRELDKDEQLSDWSDPDLSREQIEYAAKDAAVLPELASVLMRKIERAGLKRVYELERRVSYAVDQMERNGFGVDIARLAEFIEESTEQAERLKAELEEEWEINPGSSKQLREHFNLDERKGWPTTPGGSPSTNQDAMALLADEVPEISKWLEWKRVEKLRSTYGKSLQIQKRDPSLRICQRSSSARPSVRAFCSSRSGIPHSRSSGVKSTEASSPTISASP